MDEKDLVEGMREYISLLQKEGRYSSAKSYQDAMNSFLYGIAGRIVSHIHI